jgi:hypothetical protein
MTYEKKKTIKLIDVLPTVFGFIAIVGLLSWTPSGYWAETGLSPIMFLAGGAATLITGLASVINAISDHTFTKIHALNIVWALSSALYFCFLVLVYFIHPLRFTF